MSSEAPENATFDLVKEVGEDVWIAVRRGDPSGEQFLARPLHRYQGPRQCDNARQFGKPGVEPEAFDALMHEGERGNAVTQILNHENLVSIVGRIDLYPFSQTQTSDNTPENKKSYLVWDFCDASTLANIFANYDAINSPFQYLHETFCWHVLRSLVRAVAFLHDGAWINRKGDVDPRSVPDMDVVRPNLDWAPILHRDIKPANIFFQQPRGTETYGLCKLGNFSHAFVSSHHLPSFPSNPNDLRKPGCALNRHRGHESLWDMIAFKNRQRWNQFPKAQRAYDVRAELFSVGAVVFTMMTGHALNMSCEDCGCCHITWCSLGGCLRHSEYDLEGVPCNCPEGGCPHVNQLDECVHGGEGGDMFGWPPCPPEHECEQPVINIDSFLARARYSKLLIERIKSLVKWNPDKGGHLESVAHVWSSVETSYAEWKRISPDGRRYRNLEDDLWARAEQQPESEETMSDHDRADLERRLDELLAT